jgi:uncharacterized protein YjdB
MFCFIAYTCLSGFLIYQASLDGDASSEQSGAVGDELSGIINNGAGDQTVLIEPTGLEITNIINEGEVGKSHKLKCITLPIDASFKALVYSSSNSKVASISSSGTIKFLKEGEVEIKVSNKDYPSIYKTFNIEIKKIDLISLGNVLMEGSKFVVDEDEDGVIELDQYKTYLIENVFYPEDASIKKVTYTYDKEYITISNDKIITKKPTVDPIEIIASCDGITNSFKISIKEVIIEVIALKDYTLEKTKLNMSVNQQIKLSSNPFGIKFSPSNATDKEVTYTSKNDEIVKVEKSNLVAVSPGSVEIEIVSHDGEIKKLVQIEVKNIIALDQDNPVSIEQEYLEYNEKDNTYHIRNGFSGDIKVNFTSNTTYRNTVFSSSNEKVLKVGNDGVITPIKIGKASITVTIDDGILDPVVYEINFVIEGKPFIENLSEFYYIVRKSIGHFGAFFVLGGLGAFAFLLTFDRKRWLFSAPLTITLGFCMAALTEYIQTFVPGRYGCWDDVWLDFYGYMSSTLLVIILLTIIYKVLYYKNKKKAN